MKLAMIGLGRMGLNMTRRLLKNGHEVSAYDRSAGAVEQAAREGAEAAASLADAVEKLAPPRIVWIMLPAGAAVENTLEQCGRLLAAGDIVIDGGNTYYRDDIRRAKRLSPKGIRFVDVGVSGGIWGLRAGYCLMIGGDRKTCDHLRPVFESLAPPGGYLYCGTTGAGHFVKMVHNGIEYALMQAYGEGFEILEASPYADTFNFGAIADLWNRGSVIRSWLLELAAGAFRQDDRLSGIGGQVADSGEGRWTVQQAIDTGVPAEVITLSVLRRFRSRQQNPFTERVLAALRREFGGHDAAPPDS